MFATEGRKSKFLLFEMHVFYNTLCKEVLNVVNNKKKKKSLRQWFDPKQHKIIHYIIKNV